MAVKRISEPPQRHDQRVNISGWHEHSAISNCPRDRSDRRGNHRTSGDQCIDDLHRELGTRCRRDATRHRNDVGPTHDFQTPVE
jgi:hypothetical protein